MNLTLFLCIMGILTSGSNLFLYYYFGHTVTDCYADISDDVFNSDWFKQSLDVQKYFLMIIQNAQHLNYFDGFGLTYLTLNNYCKVWGFLFFSFFGAKNSFISDLIHCCQFLHDVQDTDDELIRRLLNILNFNKFGYSRAEIN